MYAAERAKANELRVASRGWRVTGRRRSGTVGVELNPPGLTAIPKRKNGSRKVRKGRKERKRYHAETQRNREKKRKNKGGTRGILYAGQPSSPALLPQAGEGSKGVKSPSGGFRGFHPEGKGAKAFPSPIYGRGWPTGRVRASPPPGDGAFTKEKISRRDAEKKREEKKEQRGT